MDIKLNEREYYQLIRKRKGITLQDIADHIGCSVGLLSLYENGKLVKSIDAVKMDKYKAFIDSK